MWMTFRLQFHLHKFREIQSPPRYSKRSQQLMFYKQLYVHFNLFFH